ncbi:MotA/TolQ/ExbB proton channel family protein [Dysgonomonas sp. Marseille-P4361]|uniref:MotA/TolQ/ExbB proton channel family protein n=1 Tax=Dysgonomonas sp. Marseille-P4361 TaxID=2161820 RepID=UPI000D555594|nr:MotA/TolQ/ExbB proton channel family protein [Dysgonomonas sp. Marseille-P4361]
MELIFKALFWVANSLLIPDVIILLCLFFRSLILLGSFYNQFMTKRKNDKILNNKIKESTATSVSELNQLLPEKDNSLYIKYLRELLNTKPSEAYADFLISNFENEADKDLSLSKILAKMGPVLGLIGTLIAMSPALVGLSTGDIAGMAHNMQVVFAATVIGLVVSAVGLLTQQFKQRWYARDVNNLDFVANLLTEKQN